MESKQEELLAAKKAQKEKRDARKGLYRTFVKTDVYKDLSEFMANLRKSYEFSAHKGVGQVNGQPATLTPEQRCGMMDRADVLDIIEEYIKLNIS